MRIDKLAKLIVSLGMVVLLGVSCSDSLSPNSKNGDSSLGQGGQYGAGIAAPDTLWTIVPNQKLTAKQKKHFAKYISLKPNGVNIIKKYKARLNKHAFSMLHKKKKLAFPISHDSTIVAVRQKLSKGKEDSTFRWKGILPKTKGKKVEKWIDIGFANYDRIVGDGNVQLGGEIHHHVKDPDPLIEHRFPKSISFIPISDHLLVIIHVKN